MTQRTLPIRRAGLAVAVTAAVGLAAAQVPLNGEQLRTWVFGSGAVEQSAPATAIRATVGQAVAGTTAGASGGAAIGFWQQDEIVVGVTPETAAIPGRTRLLQNHPNPFNPRTTIRFDLATPGRTVIRVFDLRGREVARLLDEELPAGRHSVEFSPRRLASGIYFTELRHGGTREVRRLTLLK